MNAGVFDFVHMSGSARWVAITDVVCLLGGLAAVLSGVVHVLQARGRPLGGAAARLATRGPILTTVIATVTMSVAMWLRGVEVNHFPSQTMSEVIQMFTLAMLSSMVVLHFALGLQRRGPGWAILDDVLVLVTLIGGVVLPHVYVSTLSTAQRDLPPALQSYWFPPHLSSLIFSYATMGIAAAICLAWFVTRFWCGVFGGGQTRKSQLWILAGLVLVPFVQLVTVPLLVLGGVVFFLLSKSGLLPGPERLAKLEKELDEVSFRAFAVGIPFLTAGLWMGAFWAQEAWANYWGWDSKENSALITWLVYVGYIHLRMLGGYRGSKAMAVLVGGALSVFLTFQVFGYLPDSQKSLHRYTDDNVRPMEGQQGASAANEQAKAE